MPYQLRWPRVLTGQLRTGRSDTTRPDRNRGVQAEKVRRVRWYMPPSRTSGATAAAPPALRGTSAPGRTPLRAPPRVHRPPPVLRVPDRPVAGGDYRAR